MYSGCCETIIIYGIIIDVVKHVLLWHVGGYNYSYMQR